MDNVDAIGSKELTTPNLWEIKKHPEDEYGFVRTEYKFRTPIKDGINSIIFKDPNDDFIETSDSTIVINRDFKSIINYVQDGLHQDVAEEIRSGNPIWSDKKTEVIKALLATSLYDRDGNLKEYSDYSEFEGSALLFVWLAYKDKDPGASKQAFDTLMKRRKYLSKDRRQIRTIDPSIELGEIPQEKIYVTHTTDFLPFINKDTGKVHILPRIDTDGVPRWTIHTFVNGMVEGHSTAGLDSNSWENQKYFIGMKFIDTVRDNGLPANFFKADTFWSLNPGRGLIVPPGSFIIMPDTEIENIAKYKDLGFIVKTYDLKNGESVRTASEKLFIEKNIPIIKNIDPKVPRYDDEEFASKVGLRATSHDNFRNYSDSEKMLIFSSDRIIKLARENLNSNTGEILDFDAFDALSFRINQRMEWYDDRFDRTRKHAISITLRHIFDVISKYESYYERKMPKEVLLTAVTAKII